MLNVEKGLPGHLTLPPEAPPKTLYPYSLPEHNGLHEQWTEIDHVHLLPSATNHGFLANSDLFGCKTLVSTL